MKNHIRAQKINIIGSRHPCFQIAKFPQQYQSLTRASKKIIKEHMRDHLTFHQLLTQPLTTTGAKVLTPIKRKYFMQYPSFMKRDSNIKNLNKSGLFHHDNGHNTEECHALKKR